MAVSTTTNITDTVRQAATRAGLTITSVEAGSDFSGNPTTRIVLARAEAPQKTAQLELPESFAEELAARAELLAALDTYLAGVSQRLRNPLPSLFITLHGLPVLLEEFQWPFHRSVSGADSFVVHGLAKLADDSPLHSKVAASLTVTFAEVLLAQQQPYAEGIIFNAVRKTFDLEQLELVKSGNRQPVGVTTRFYSRRKNGFVFADSTEDQVKEWLDAKLYWSSRKNGGAEPVWIADPYDAQYVNRQPEELKQIAAGLAKEGSLTLDTTGEFATPTAALLAEAEHYNERLQATLAALKPKFNEEMRAGHTNM